MTPKKFLALIEKQQPELLKLVRDDLPRIVGTKAMQHFRENFARGGFVDRDLEPWEVTWRQKTLSGADGQRGPLLSRTNTLRGRIYFRASAGRATIYNNLIYAAIHNEGGNITVTPKMRKKFWAMYYQALRAVESTAPKGKRKKTDIRHQNANAESEKWKRMALTKKTQFKMPQRKFIGPSQTLTNNLRTTVENEIRKVLIPK